MLETLLCDSILENPENRCIEDYFGCIASLRDHPLSSLDKARARVYLAAKPRPHLSVGLAAKAGYWNLDHEVFKTFGDFDRAMRQEAGWLDLQTPRKCAEGRI